MEKKDQATWADRNEQVSFSKKINDLLAKKFGRTFGSKYQGAGKIATLVIEGHGINPKIVEEMRKFLTKQYGLKLHRINGHSHIAGTIVIHISEVSEASRKKVEDDFKRLIISPAASKQAAGKTLTEKKQIATSNNTEKEIKVVSVENTEITEQKNETTEKTAIVEKFSVIKRGRLALSLSLNAMFKFEKVQDSVKIFSFDENREDDLQILNFIGDEEAQMALFVINWQYQCAKNPDGPVRDGSQLMLNFFSLDIMKDNKRPSYLFFVLPPLKGASEEDIFRRGKKILTGYEPKVQILSDEEFTMTYPTTKTNEKIFNFIVEMGWESRLENNSIISKFRTFGASTISSAESTPAVTVVQKTEEPQKVLVVEKTEEPKANVILSVKNLFTQEEAIEKFKKLHADELRWANTPSEKQQKIVGILRKNLKESSLEVFAEYLLKVSFLTNPLFTQEESVEELKAIMNQDDFGQLPNVIQGKILSALKDSLSDDDILDDLLDMF